MHTITAIPVPPRAYAAYGAGVPLPHARSAFAGQVAELDTGWYLLGNRPYSPTLRCFLAPDTSSPFDKGGVHRYAYCSGDPINRIDPTGEAWTDWLMVGIALTFAVVGTVVSAGALAGTIAAAGSLAAAAATSGIVATTVAAVADVVVLSATIGSTVTMATQDAKLNGIFGWVSLGAGLVSGAAMTAAVKQGAEFGRGVGKAAQATSSRAASSAGAASMFSARAITAARSPTRIVDDLTMLATAAATSAVRNVTTPKSTSGRAIVSLGRQLQAPELRSAVQGVSDSGARSATVYTGTPGARRQPERAGAVMGARTPVRSDPHNLARQSRTASTDVSVVETDRLTQEQTRQRLNESGVAVTSKTFGLLDTSVLASLNFPEGTSSDARRIRASM